MNQEKVKQMVKLASYEKRGIEDLETLGFFKADYVSYNTFIILVGVSLSLILFFLGDIGGQFFDNMQDIIEFDFIGQGMDYLTIWIVFMVIYGVAGSFIYRKRYNDSKRRVDIYKKMLRDLNRL